MTFVIESDSSMAVIGKIVKKTSELGTKRSAGKPPTFKGQVKTLHKLIKTASKTEFGLYYRFDDVLFSEDFIRSFQKQVPFSDYDSMYRHWIHRAMDGAPNVIWPGKIKYYALSSGTTGSPSKRIPITKQMIRSFQKNSIKQFASTSRFDLSDEFYQKSFLVVGGSSQPEKVGPRFEGDLSGILKKHTSVVLQPLTKPDPKTAAIKDWSKKLDKMVEMAPNWDIATVAGSPTWCIMLLERIVERYQLKHIHELWPHFELYVWGGVYIEPYLDRFEKICGKKVHLLNTYLASEGYMAFQNNPESKGMQLLTKSGIFFEFIPFNADNFDASGSVLPHAKAYTLDEVKEGVDYALVISTNAGLWRYIIGDLVQFTDASNYEIIISGRIKQYLILTGEHLSLDNINNAIRLTAAKTGVSIPEFCICVDEVNQKHYWYFGVADVAASQDIMNSIDQELCALNDDYASCRKYNTLRDPEAHFLPISKFYEFMETRGKFGSQQKFPRVMTQHQANDWKLFIGEV